MSRDELARLIDDYSAHGGTVRAVDEGVVTVDWGRETMLRKFARAMSRRGHAKRRAKKKNSPLTRSASGATASRGAPSSPSRGEEEGWIGRRGCVAVSGEGGFAS